MSLSKLIRCATLILTLLAGGCTATPINLPNNDGASGYKKDAGGTAADSAAMKDTGLTPPDKGQPWADAGAKPDSAVSDGMTDGITDGLTDGLKDATGEAGAKDGGAGEGSVGKKDALSGE